MISFIKYCIMFFLSGTTYYTLEILWRGRSHIAMIFVGGGCFLAIGAVNEICKRSGIHPPLQIFLSVASVLLIEFVSGMYLNLYLGLHVWNYATLPFNILGQVCLYFALLWIPLCMVAIELDNTLKVLLFGYERIGFLRHFLRG